MSIILFLAKEPEPEPASECSFGLIYLDYWLQWHGFSFPHPNALAHHFIVPATGFVQYFSINRPAAQYLVLELRIVGSNGVYQHTRTGIRATASELNINHTEIIVATSFTGGGSNYVVSLVEGPYESQLDIRVQSGTGDTNVVTCYLSVWASSGVQPPVILR